MIDGALSLKHSITMSAKTICFEKMNPSLSAYGVKTLKITVRFCLWNNSIIDQGNLQDIIVKTTSNVGFVQKTFVSCYFHAFSSLKK